MNAELQDQPTQAECAHCGETMSLIDGLYYIHASTGKPYCLAIIEEEETARTAYWDRED